MLYASISILLLKSKIYMSENWNEENSKIMLCLMCKFLIRKLYSWIDNVAVHEH